MIGVAGDTVGKRRVCEGDVYHDDEFVDGDVTAAVAVADTHRVMVRGSGSA